VDPNIPKSTTLKSISNEFFLLLLPIYSSWAFSILGWWDRRMFWNLRSRWIIFILWQ
jgi:hypothetical protein